MNQKQRFHQESQTPVNADVLLIRPVSKQRWELTKDKVNLIRKIGAGQFGEIWEGTLHESPRVPPIIVAVKVTKVIEENKEKVTEMYMEARLMRQYKHKNVVAFYGVVQERPDRAMIVMELVSGGTHHNRNRIVRDVACRNCLIDTKNKIVKISDFGMSKVAEKYDIPKTEKLPIRWYEYGQIFIFL
ncbi:unnamed protein product [Heligmosomoides polygyrus]|uniref:Protein kinase domain-containing protein n=1 Tax=Heligmosomoides polygyrus TaxID=6339 RepID=A0A183GKT3_HELPZ|nr:unnamed protein product [Heligmosomoides polygyrus]